MSKANERQVGGDHYFKKGDLQPWDIAAIFGLDFFQGNVVKYVMRWKDKGGVEDLEKAQHYLEKYIEVLKTGKGFPNEQANYERPKPREETKQHPYTRPVCLTCWGYGELLGKTQIEKCPRCLGSGFVEPCDSYRNYLQKSLEEQANAAERICQASGTNGM